MEHCTLARAHSPRASRRACVRDAGACGCWRSLSFGSQPSGARFGQEPCVIVCGVPVALALHAVDMMPWMLKPVA